MTVPAVVQPGGDDALAFPGLPNAWTVSGATAHLYEDFSTYATVASIASTNRVDGGVPWQNVQTSALSLQTGSLSPWFSGKRLRSTHPSGSGLGGGYCFDGAFEGGSHNFLRNAASLESSWVLQFAFRCPNSVMYCGKLIDCTCFTGGVTHRWVDETQSSGRIGATTTPSCDADGYCSNYFEDNGDTPLVAGTTPNATSYDFVWFTGMSSPATNNCFYKMNRNGATGGLQNNLASYEGGDWWLRTDRWSMAEGGDGRGRFEAWETNAAGVTRKIAEVLGDAGAFDEPFVYTPRLDVGEEWIPLTAFHVCNPSRADTGDGWNGGSQIEFGGISVMTHPKMALAA